MEDYYEKIKRFINNMGLEIVSEDRENVMFVVNNYANGILNLIIQCQHPILILEQHIMSIPEKNKEFIFLRLLQMNRSLIHGAFVVDEKASNIIFRDTLQIENLDLNEFEGSIRSLIMGLIEFGDELISLKKN